MNQLKYDTNGTLADQAPLFASNLLALFYMLRKCFYERQIPVKPAGRALQPKEE